MSALEATDAPVTGMGHSVGRASRKAAGAAISGHVMVLKGKPLRAAISEALAQAENLGGKERRFVAWAVRELSRHLRRIDLSARARGRPFSGLQLDQDRAILRYALWRHELTGASVERALLEVALPGPVRPRSILDTSVAETLNRAVTLDFGPTPLEQAANRHSFPTWLAEALERAAPPGEVEAVLEALNREPVLTLRARGVERAALLAALKAENIDAGACPEADNAIQIEGEGRSIFETRWMKNGQLQVMDLGSQLLAGLCRAAPGMSVVDYCAGAGGKTLFLADAVGPTGRVYAWDANPKRLREAKERSKGLRHVSFPDAPRLDLAQVVLVDAPCSGTGTLGREPDQKWKLTPKSVSELAQKQRTILGEVANQVRDGAVVVYGTCSLLREENEDQVQQFLSTHPGWRLDEELRVWPHRIAGGGFYGARLVKGR